MKKLFSICFCALSTFLISQSNYFPLWHKQWAGTQFLQKMYEIDKQGNHIIIGDLNGTYDFDPSPATYNLNTTGGKDGGAIMKLDSNGVFLWAKKIVATNDIYITNLSIDGVGNIYYTIQYGYTGVVDVDPGAAVINATISSASPNQILVSLDKNGNYRWHRQFAVGSTASINIQHLKIDRNNQVFIYANNGNSLFDIDFGPSVANVPLGFFYARYDTLGNYLWNKSVSTYTTNPNIFKLDFDYNNNLIIQGVYDSTTDFDYSPSIYSLLTPNISNSYNYYVMKTDAQLNFNWVNAFHSIGSSELMKTLIDTSNNIFICGYSPSQKFCPKYNDTTYFHSTTGSWTWNPFIIKYNGFTGNFMNDFYMYRPDPFDFDVGSDGKIYVSGVLAGTADFDPSASTYNLTGGVLGDAFMAVYDNNFNFYRAYKYTNQPAPDDYQCGFFIKSWGPSIYLYSLQNGNVNYGSLYYPYMINSTYAKALIKFNMQGVTTSIKEEPDPKFSLYPNPTNDKFYFELNSPDKVNIALYDINGRQVYSEILNSNSNIDVSNLVQGIYTVTIKKQNYVTTKKLVILR
ncbi:MAG: T9SS type A sorting domain-containing protein [Bacteroidetes bacterium]|nr:T9SS type A sorting domain-containing protein [Bacteroidota bacterium]